MNIDIEDKLDLINDVLEEFDCYFDVNSRYRNNNSLLLTLNNLNDGSIISCSNMYLDRDNIWFLKAEGDIYFIISDTHKDNQNSVSVYAYNNFYDDDGKRSIDLLEGYTLTSGIGYSDIKCFINESNTWTDISINNNSISVKYNDDVCDEYMDLLYYDKTISNNNSFNDNYIFKDRNGRYHLLNFICKESVDGKGTIYNINKNGIGCLCKDGFLYENSPIKDFYDYQDALNHFLKINDDVDGLVSNINGIIPFSFFDVASKYAFSSNDSKNSIRKFLLAFDRNGEKVISK